MPSHEHHHDARSEQHLRVDSARAPHHHEHGPIVDHVHTVAIHGTQEETVTRIEVELCRPGMQFLIDEDAVDTSMNAIRERRMNKADSSRPSV